MASQFITSSKRVGRFEFIQKHFQQWTSKSPSSGSMESLVSTGSELSLNSIGYSSCSSDIVSVTNSVSNSASSSTSTTGDSKPDIQTPVDKFVNIAKEDRVHSSLDDLFSNLLIKIGNYLFIIFILYFVQQDISPINYIRCKVWFQSMSNARTVCSSVIEKSILFLIVLH